MEVTSEFYKTAEKQFIITVASCFLTSAEKPQYFCLKPMQYFIIQNGVVYFYDDQYKEYLEYDSVENIDFDYVDIAQLRDMINNENPESICSEDRKIINNW